MKTSRVSSRLATAAAALVVLAAAATPALAQGRHDDRLHGMKRAGDKPSGHPPPHTSGRHSDIMHGATSGQKATGAAGAARPAPAVPDSPAPATPPADGAKRQ